jgi:hypothetical protein
MTPKPADKPVQSKIEVAAKGVLALVTSRLASIVAVPLLLILWNSVQSGINEGKLAAEGARIAAAAAFAQVSELAVLIASLTAELQGEQRAQGIINDNTRFALLDHEDRIRLLEMWQRNVLNRATAAEPPPL